MGRMSEDYYEAVFNLATSPFEARAKRWQLPNWQIGFGMPEWSAAILPDRIYWTQPQALPEMLASMALSPEFLSSVGRVLRTFEHFCQRDEEGEIVEVDIPQPFRTASQMADHLDAIANELQGLLNPAGKPFRL